jgi:hypothetical protein
MMIRKTSVLRYRDRDREKAQSAKSPQTTPRLLDISGLLLGGRGVDQKLPF